MYRISLLSLTLSLSTLCANPQPDIIFVLCDDLGWGDLAFYHEAKYTPQISSPNLDAMAAQGLQLRRHYSAAPVSAPARASLLTGTHQGQSEVVRNNNFDAALENTTTLASLLQHAGYKSALIGKWGIGGGDQSAGCPNSSAAWPSKRGFDYFFGYHNHIAGHSQYPKEEGNRAIWDRDRVITDSLDNCYSTDLFTARAKQWLIEQKKHEPKRPVFLMLNLTAPHARLGIPNCPYPAGGGIKGGLQWLGQSGRMINTALAPRDSYINPEYRNNQQWEKRARELNPKHWKRTLLAAQRHASMVSRIDDAMGDLRQLCQDLGIAKNSIIILTSDNGAHNEAGSIAGRPNHPSPQQNPAFFTSYGKSDGIKRDLWDGGLLVPCLIYAPGYIKQARISHTPSQFHDWMPTLAELAGAPIPLRSTGTSLLPSLLGNPQPMSGVYSEYCYPGNMPCYPSYAPNKQHRKRGEQQMLYFCDSDGRELKAIRSNIRSGYEDFEIYDTLRDSQESHNIADQLPEGTQEQLRSQALRMRRAYNYQHDPALSKRKGAISGKRPYDNIPIPANQAQSTQQGIQLRQVKASSPYVPTLESLSPLPISTSQCADLGNLQLPAGSISELRGYIQIPPSAQGWQFRLRLSPVEGSKAQLRLHQLPLIDADSNYKAGDYASSSSTPNAEEGIVCGNRPIYLQPGLHEIQLNIIQGKAAAGNIQLQWQRVGERAMQNIPASALRLKLQ